MQEKNYIYTAEDVLERERYRADRFLVLHPLLIEDELKKADVCSMIYTGRYKSLGEQNLFFVKGKPIELRRYTHNILNFIPKEVIYPIGGLAGRYYIKVSDIGDEIHRFYDVYDSDNHRCVIKNVPMRDFIYLDNDYAILESYIITRGSIIQYGPYDRYGYDKYKGYFLVERDIEPKYGRRFSLYDAYGTLIQLAYLRKEIDATIGGMPKGIFPAVESVFPSETNAQMFINMIVDSLKGCSELADCDADDLVGITAYLYERGLQLVVELDTMRVCKVDFAKYFNAWGYDEDTEPAFGGTQHIMRPVSQNKGEN